MRLAVTGLTLLVLSAPAALTAQVCLGKPSLDGSPVNLGGHLEFMEGATRYGGEVVLGSRAFVSGAYTHTDFDTGDQSLEVVGATLGYDVPNDDASMCLGVSGGYGFGLEDAGADVTSMAIGPVLAVGVDSELSSTVSLIQFGEFGWYWEKVTSDFGPAGEDSATSDYGLLLLGFSLVFGETVSIGPAVTFPIELEGAPKIFTFALTIAP